LYWQIDHAYKYANLTRTLTRHYTVAYGKRKALHFGYRGESELHHCYCITSSCLLQEKAICVSDCLKDVCPPVQWLWMAQIPQFFC